MRCFVEKGIWWVEVPRRKLSLLWRLGYLESRYNVLLAYHYSFGGADVELHVCTDMKNLVINLLMTIESAFFGVIVNEPWGSGWKVPHASTARDVLSSPPARAWAHCKFNRRIKTRSTGPDLPAISNLSMTRYLRLNEGEDDHCWHSIVWIVTHGASKHTLIAHHRHSPFLRSKRRKKARRPGWCSRQSISQRKVRVWKHPYSQILSSIPAFSRVSPSSSRIDESV